MHAVIFANGRLETPIRSLPPHDLLIAADGGARLAFSSGLIPDEVIGDLDSLSESEIAGFERAGAGIQRYPEDKDQSDLELSLDFARQAGADEVTCYGLFGGRWDMSFANLFLLASPAYAGMKIQAFEGQTCFYILHGGQALELNGPAGSRVSVLPLSDEVRGLTYEGLAWGLEDAVLFFGSTRGVSNMLLSTRGQVLLEQGTLLVVHELPEKE
jgi:thiamine pyrophosphokinase